MHKRYLLLNRCRFGSYLERSGRPKATTESEDEFLRVNSSCDTAYHHRTTASTCISPVKTRLQAAGLTGRVGWAMKHRRWTTEDWKKVLCFSRSSRHMVRT
uniref:Transposase Tc1-like domain-containing protein n=1 Tax=Neolamprologus brichardi TaxID=32507 RepID=A0A3Q4MCX6_NEOBR